MMRDWVLINDDGYGPGRTTRLIQRCIKECLNGIEKWCDVYYLTNNVESIIQTIKQTIPSNQEYSLRGWEGCFLFPNNNRLTVEHFNAKIDLQRLMIRFKGHRGFLCVDNDQNVSIDLLAQYFPILYTYNEYLMIKANE